MSELKDNNEDTDHESEFHSQLQCKNISTAVREILQKILLQSKKANVHVSIKSTKSRKNTPRKSWFFIKVSSRSRIDSCQFEGRNRNQALYAILEYMQSFEDESHFCIQNPCNLDEDGHCSVQQNLFLEGEMLKFGHEVKRSKQIKDSTLHLRVHQSVIHMMRESTHIHRYMAQIRIFRPKVDMSFTVNFGEAVSHTDFRIENRKKLASYLPSVVTDSTFYLQDSDMKTTTQTVTPCIADPVLISGQVLTVQNEYKTTSIQMSPIAVYIPVVESEASFCALTFYGPGYLPLDETVPCTLLEHIEWNKYNLKIDGGTCTTTYKSVLPCHDTVALRSSHSGYDTNKIFLHVIMVLQSTDISDTAIDFQEINQSLGLMLKEHAHTMISIIQRTVDKLLQPVINNAKTRTLVIKSINSVGKAVTNIVSMSSNEHFRKTVLNCFKVSDTVELGAEMKSKLTDISQRKHSAVWSGHTMNHISQSMLCQQNLGGMSRICQESYNDGTQEDEATKFQDNTTETIQKEDNTLVIETIKVPGDKQDYNNEKIVRYHIDKGIQRSTAQTLNDSSDLNHAGTNKTHSDGYYVDKLSTRCTETIGSKHDWVDRTPEIQQIIEDMDKVSPFHQLIEDSPVTMTDITPDIAIITQGMKDVSPFQQLACEHKTSVSSPQVSTEDPCLPDNCLQIVPDVKESQGTESFEFNKDLRLSFCCGVQHKQDIVKSKPDKSELFSSCKDDAPFPNTFSAKQVNEHMQISKSDFELLNSEDFGETCEIVSDYIDEKETSEKPDIIHEELESVRDDLNEKVKHNTNPYGKMTQCLGNESNISSNKAGKKETASVENDMEEANVQDLDDWFNDVLIEVGEWLD